MHRGLPFSWPRGVFASSSRCRIDRATAIVTDGHEGELALHSFLVVGELKRASRMGVRRCYACVEGVGMCDDGFEVFDTDANVEPIFDGEFIEI